MNILSDPQCLELGLTAGTEEFAFQLNMAAFLSYKQRPKMETKSAKAASHAG